MQKPDLSTIIREALLRDAGYEQLLETVRAYKTAGASQRETYDSLQQIWLDFGFNGIDTGSQMQNDLEYVLEVVWYGMRETWETSLTISN